MMVVMVGCNDDDGGDGGVQRKRAYPFHLDR